MNSCGPDSILLNRPSLSGIELTGIELTNGHRFGWLAIIITIIIIILVYEFFTTIMKIELHNTVFLLL